jgi:hypothetical protein
VVVMLRDDWECPRWLLVCVGVEWAFVVIKAALVF